MTVSPSLPEAIPKEIDPLAVRRKRLGGSDVPAVLGVDPFRTGHDVWLEKLGLRERTPENEFMRMGKLLEPVIAAEYAVREQVEFLQLTDHQRFVRHPRHPWLGGHVDRLIAGQPIGMDAKSTDPYNRRLWGDPGTDEVPDHILLQMHTYLTVLEHIERFDVAVLMGNTLHIYRVQRSIEMSKIIIEHCGEWWERYVVGQTPPPVDHSRASRDMLQRIFPRLSGQIRTATPAETETVLAFQAARGRAIQTREEADLFENRVCALIGEDDGVQGPWGRITWKRTKDSQRVDWEAVAKALWNEIALRSGHPNPLLSLTLTKDTFGEIVQRHSTPVHGTRRFYPRFTREGEER